MICSRKTASDAIVIINKIRLVLKRESAGQTLPHRGRGIQTFRSPTFIEHGSDDLPVFKTPSNCVTGLRTASSRVDPNELTTVPPFIFKLPLELLHLISYSLDVQSLCHLICTSRHLSRSLIRILHERCGLKISAGTGLHLKTHIQGTDDRSLETGTSRVIMFQAFRSFHRAVCSERMHASFSEDVEEAVQHFLFGLSCLTPGSVKHLRTSFSKPLSACNSTLSSIVSAASRLQVKSLHITYPFPAEHHTFDSPLSIEHLGLLADLNQPFHWDLLCSAGNSLESLTLVHDVPWTLEPEPTDLWTDYTALRVLRLPCLTSLTISVETPPHILAEFLHHHPTLTDLEVGHFGLTRTKPVLDPSTSPKYVYSLKKLTGPPNYLDVLLEISSVPLTLDWFTSTLSIPSGAEDRNHFEGTLRCISRCGHIRALTITLPDYSSETWIPEPASSLPITAVDTAIKTIRLLFSECSDAPSNDAILKTFVFWHRYAPTANDLQYIEYVYNNGREELTRTVDAGSHSKVSIKSGPRTFKNNSPVTPYGWWWR